MAVTARNLPELWLTPRDPARSGYSQQLSRLGTAQRLDIGRRTGCPHGGERRQTNLWTIGAIDVTDSMVGRKGLWPAIEPATSPQHQTIEIPVTESSEHTETFRATARGKGWPTTVQISETEWTLQLDEPTDDGGTNSGANPMQYFAASLAGCQNEQAQVVAGELGVSIQSIDLELEIDLDLSGFMGLAEHSDRSYKAVRMTASVAGDLSKEQASELGQRVDRRCPILGLLRSSGADIQSTWTLA